MKKQPNDMTDAQKLRQRAEEQLLKKYSSDFLNKSGADLNKLIHELQVHQIELEIQNEELQLAIERAETASEKFAELYDYAPTGYLTLNPEGKILRINLRGAMMLKKERLYLANSNLKSYVTYDSLPIFNSFLNNVFNASSVLTCEIKLTINENNSTFVYIEGKIPEDEKSCFITMVDITSRKMAEQKLEQYYNHIKELNVAKDKLYSIIAHDLRSPLGSILGLSELLVDDKQNYDIENSKEFVKKINDTAVNTLILLDNLLAWIKTQTGKISFKPEIIQLQPVIQEIMDGLCAQAAIKDILINCSYLDHKVVCADQNMLKTILRNLVSNAIKFTNSGGKIEIMAVSDQSQTEITISDNGVGINEEAINKLFKVDTNITTYGTADEKGSGLGLILCNEFVKKHGGKLWVESEVGKGSSFKFVLPIVSQPQNIKNI
jgi:signal transduction histidine kinase